MALKPPSNERPGWKGRLAALLFSGLFATAFGGVGLFMGLWPLLQTAGAAWQVRHWQPVQAVVLSSTLQSHRGSEGGTVYGVRAEYAYEFGGQRYVAHRVGLDVQSQSDNLGDWHEQWHDRLRQAQARGENVTAWVNPQQPHQAVLDKQVRWPLAAFRLPFALLFTAVGAVAAWAFVRILLGHSIGPGADSAAAVGALARPSTDLRPVPQRQAGLWILALVWLLFCLPFVAGLWSRPGAGRWIALGFFAVGCFIVWAAARETLRARRFRGARLSSVPSRVCTGQPLQVLLTLPPSAQAAWSPWAGAAQAPEVTLRLGLHHIDDSGSSRDTRMLWEQTCHARLQVLPDGSARCSGRFSLPADAAPTGAIRQRERVQWLLEVLDPGLHDQTRFEIVVHQGVHQGNGVTDAPRSSAAGPHPTWPHRAEWKTEYPIVPPLEGEHAPAMPATVKVLEDAMGWRLVFQRRAPRVLALLALLAAVSALWPALGPLLSGAPGPHAMAAWRLAAAAALLALALHGASARWIVQVSDAGLHIDRSSWLWSRVSHLADGQVRDLVHKLSYTTSSGSQSVEHHALWLKTRAQGDVKLSPALAHAVAARTVAWHLQAALAHHRGRFAPSMSRSAAAATGALGTPLGVCLLAWLVWLAAMLAVWYSLAAGTAA